MSKSFDEAIDESLVGFFGDWHGKVIGRSYGTTRFGQRFAFITTKALWYEVRLYMHEDHLENRLLHWYELTDHKTVEGAADHVTKRTEELQSPTDVLCNYSDLFRRYPSYPIEMVIMPSDCRANPEKYLKPGDHVVTEFVMFATHEAIYVGENKVIHITKDHNSGKAIKEDTWENFLESKWISSIVVQVYRVRGRTPEEILKYAREFMEQNDDTQKHVKKRFPHFASLCACNHELSSGKRQVLRFVRDTPPINPSV